jgi:uncharacterized protein
MSFLNPAIQTRFLDSEWTYRGPELRPHFILSQFKIEGSALIAFRGACDVKTDHLVDWEDKLQNDFIRAESMIHFLGEFFGATLAEGVWIQRLLVAEWAARLRALGFAVDREGDDLFWNAAHQKRLKLSVSIVTASPVSVLLHLGVNVNASGAPVPAAGLQDLGMKPAAIEAMVRDLLQWFETEVHSVLRACVKVRPVV